MSRKFLQVFLIIVGLAMATVASAEIGRDLFEDGQTYDVHFYGGEAYSSVIENVSIEGFQQIAGKEFLVLSSKGFKLSQESGFIAFESIIAILPNRHFKVRKTNSIQFRERR